MQQIEACHNIVGIPQEWAIDMTGQISPAKRARFWRDKRVFFVTPQVLEKDIQSGSCFVDHLVCLVIDEAHRAVGNYSYSVAVRELMAVPVQLRILALTATPGSRQQTIQHIIDNLQISQLEYRNESDHDVIAYVHDRKIELIEVPMGKDAVEIDNLLLGAIRPFVASLCAFGVLQNRDFQTLSPCHLLNSRDKFREAPPQNLPHLKYGEVEGYFGVLLTLYHIRKLLSGHGIRPTFEMLEEKLKQGFFARLMSRNEVIWEAKDLMQRSLSHGAPSPKLSKMLEVLIDHFKTKDPQNSRVIIFSNFRGSVRDILNALANIGEFVKATQFIGQSSGKTLKGQSQKVQQAVLEKFRAGGYNVIVATSIGEEGLDIMEVDLVICFDANVSPLRMIQRMGRTGRKHDGRVVVLACEGSELKGYMRKKANSKAITKHMHNGGMHSFNFHSSPRMIPHIFKPDVQFVELSIEEFIPRGKKVKNDHPIETPSFETKLTDVETDLIAKYFHSTGEITWKPSLIAFPHFQAFPSRVHKVVHSCRTGMLIDAMQHLQGLSFSRNHKAFSDKDETSSDVCLKVKTVEQHDHNMKDLQSFHNSGEADLRRIVSEPDVLPMESSGTKENHCMQDFQNKKSPIHSYLFGSDFVSVNAHGTVLVVSVPLLPLGEFSYSKCTSSSSKMLLSCLKRNSFHFRASHEDYRETTMPVKGITSTQTRFTENENLLTSRLSNSGGQQDQMLGGAEGILQSPICERNLSNEEDSICETPIVAESKTPMLFADESNNDFTDIELSPRLTNLINHGVVPESPINDAEISNGKVIGEVMVPCLVSPSQLHAELLSKTSGPEPNGKVASDSSASGRDGPASLINDKFPTPVLDVKNNTSRGCDSAFPFVEEIQTPSANLCNNGCSNEWRLSSRDKSESVEQKHKLKRLRKYGDFHRRRPLEVEEQNIGPTTNPEKHCSNAGLVVVKRGRGEKKVVKDARTFIEEEAEVSSEDTVSDDEEDEQDNNSYDDSFIDDRIDPTARSTQAEASKIDMMAIYRRSLLSQSPIVRLPNGFLDASPDSLVPMTQMNESESSSAARNRSCQMHQTELESTGKNSVSFLANLGTISSEVLPWTTNGVPVENEEKMESRKRKLSFFLAEPVPVRNLEQEFVLDFEAAKNDLSLQDQINKNEENVGGFDDDLFYGSIDLDAVEEQAAKLLRYKSKLSMQKETMIPEPIPPNLGVLGSPSFDLGI